MKDFKLVHYTLIFGLLTALCGCNQISTAKIDESGTLNADGSGTISTFAGISSIDLKTDSTLRLNWAAHADAVAYDVFDMTSGSPVWLTTVFGQSTSSTVLTNLTPNQLYNFRVRAKSSAGLNDANKHNVSVTMNLAPDMPTSLTLVTPSSSPSVVSTPLIRISGVKNGDTVKLFSDNCVTQVASAVATGTSIDLTSSALSTGSYNLHARASNSSSSSSACSTASVAYQKLTCPAGYVPVTSNAVAGTTSDFCVMKFEAKSVGGVAISQAASSPWVTISQISSKTACTDLGANYDLISNPEWMTIAYDVEATAANWDSGVVGTGALYIGHTDNAPSGGLAISDPTDPYDGTGNSALELMGSGKEQKRTFTLSNGEEIWDLAGNVWEWTDWTLGGALASGPTSCAGVWTEFPNVACGALVASEYMPFNPAGKPAGSYDAVFGLGRLYGGAGGAALRGGNWDHGTNAGVFTLYLNDSPTTMYAGTGFRCVYRP